jgi:hypothetical protein
VYVECIIEQHGFSGRGKYRSTGQAQPGISARLRQVCRHELRVVIGAGSIKAVSSTVNGFRHNSYTAGMLTANWKPDILDTLERDKQVVASVASRCCALLGASRRIRKLTND